MNGMAQSVMDALADAETLRRVSAQVLGYATSAGWLYQLPERLGTLARQAIEAGLPAVSILRAESAARAAFRAVPGLRGA